MRRKKPGGGTGAVAGALGLVLLVLGFYPTVRRWSLGARGRRVPAHVEKISCSARRCYADFLYFPELDAPGVRGTSVVIRRRTPLTGFALYRPGEGLFAGVELENDGGAAVFQRRIVLIAVGVLALFWMKSRRARRN